MGQNSVFIFLHANPGLGCVGVVQGREEDELHSLNRFCMNAKTFPGKLEIGLSCVLQSYIIMISASSITYDHTT